jgi:hypothetical protein
LEGKGSEGVMCRREEEKQKNDSIYRKQGSRISAMKREMTMTCWRNERTKQKLTFHMFLDCRIRGVGFDGADLINSSQVFSSCCERFTLCLLLSCRSAQCCANGFSFSLSSSVCYRFITRFLQWCARNRNFVVSHRIQIP